MNRYPDIAESEGNGHSAAALATGAKSAVDQASRKGKGELHNFISDVEDLITSMTPLTGADLERAKKKLAERVETAKESLAEAGTEIAERARESARVTNTYVHEHPWQSVGIGAILGLLVGIAINRRM
jgi:ElaB/YqjD/DUF883 family membrane-anchored ribosome-binding protein